MRISPNNVQLPTANLAPAQASSSSSSAAADKPEIGVSANPVVSKALFSHLEGGRPTYPINLKALADKFGSERIIPLLEMHHVLEVNTPEGLAKVTFTPTAEALGVRGGNSASAASEKPAAPKVDIAPARTPVVDQSVLRDPATPAYNAVSRVPIDQLNLKQRTDLMELFVSLRAQDGVSGVELTLQNKSLGPNSLGRPGFVPAKPN